MPGKGGSGLQMQIQSEDLPSEAHTGKHLSSQRGALEGPEFRKAGDHGLCRGGKMKPGATRGNPTSRRDVAASTPYALQGIGLARFLRILSRQRGQGVCFLKKEMFMGSLLFVTVA